ncbi:sporulation peptidase YabG [Cellulosilyticum sp. I15G10I2]|uniref:sporulation peptidase YabG n=1 Tax=Cellulosilyticum sp. I15G10I2 TaxID=1892843 RepID=UPI00085BD444|nr:sporulation peptidase YabG [Cellulosilyticum sp. I15G10I2]
MFNIGDYVVRLSYGKDILFRITYISPSQIARLKGISYRVIADAPIKDLELADGMRFTNQETNIMNTIQQNVERIMREREENKKGKLPRFQKTGTVLHIDGDAFYLNLCLKYYKILDIPAIGEHVMESEQPKKVRYLLEKYSPDILVLTGHDSLNKHYKSLYDVNEYRNSNYFIESVKRARAINPSMDDLIIFAGACQSYFEGILAAGADYAASPGRVLIHALDPVFIVEKAAQCPFHKVLSIEDALENTITKFNGLGGYEIIGKCRRGGPVVEEQKGKNKQVKPSMKVEYIKDLDIDSMTEEELERELKKPIFTDTDKEFEEKIMYYMGNTIPLK